MLAESGGAYCKTSVDSTSGTDYVGQKEPVTCDPQSPVIVNKSLLAISTIKMLCKIEELY